MKIDRLLGIITYLLNHDLVTGKYLAEKFEVSERTIQRDVDAINLAGIPILSIRGANGGYKILDTYRLSKQTTTENDLKAISLALKCLNSALEDERISSTLEKVTSISNTKANNCVNIDFSIAKENKRIVELIKVIEEAITNKLRIEISYTNTENYTTIREVEPVSLKFKWYSWYLVAYCIEKSQYRVFKLIRVTNIKQTYIQFTNNHDGNPDIFDDLMSNDSRKSINIVLKCKKSILTAVTEYLPGVKCTDITEDCFKAELIVFESERMWFAFILSFGDDIEIIEPIHLQHRLVEHSKKIIKKYEIPDI